MFLRTIIRLGIRLGVTAVIVAAAAAVFFVLSTGGASAQAAKDKSGAARAKLSVDLEGLYMRRENLDNATFVFNNAGTVNVPGDDTALKDSGELDGEWEPGGRLSVMLGDGNRWEMEVAGFWIMPFHEGADVSDPAGNLDVIVNPNLTTAFDGASFVRATYDSSIWGGEVNFRNTYQPGLTWISGVRYIQLGEGFDIKSFSSAANSGGLYDIDTRNRMIGVQGGVAGEIPLGPGLTLSFTGLGGAFANQSRMRQIIIDNRDVAPAVIRYERDGNLDLAWMGEGRIGVGLDLNPFMTVGVGYQVLYLGNVALAPLQTDLFGGVGGGNGIDNGGNVIYHGGRAYLLLRF